MNRQDDYSFKIGGYCPNGRRFAFAFLSLTILLFLSYSNSFEASWHHDDYANIVANVNIQIQGLSWQDIQKGLSGIGGGDRWQRPAAYFSFALNYYFGALDVFGYHIVNFLIHCFTAFFLFLFIFDTLHLPWIKHRYSRHAYSIALLSTILWAINPVHVAAVTYIVQRMASMAGLFCIMTMFFYLRGRTVGRLRMKIIWFGLSALAFLLAVGTKENAAMLPMTLFLYDLILIQGVTRDTLIKNLKYAVPCAVAVLLIGFLYVGDLLQFQEEYQPRVFTMMERMLTQPRVLLFYLSLLFYPVTSRLTLIHDIDISRSLLDPVTTLFSLIALFLMVATAILYSRKTPLISYCILFFFLNHLIEGSFIALELVYEHRNYLPSMLLFLPISLGIIEGFSYYRQKISMLIFLAAAVVLVVIVQGVSVFMQNEIYKNEISLWSDNVQKSPRLHYVSQNLATSYFVAGRLTEAFNEGHRALSLSLSAGMAGKRKTHAMLGEYHYLRGEDDLALLHYRKSIELDPTIHTNYWRISEIMRRKGRLIEAEEMILKALSTQSDSYAYHAILAGILLQQGRPDEAVREARISLRLNGDQPEAYTIIAEASKLRNDQRNAEHFKIIAEAFRSRQQTQQPKSLFHKAQQ